LGRGAKAVAPELFISSAVRACLCSFWRVFAKNEKADLSAAKRNALGKAVADMIESYRRKK